MKTAYYVSTHHKPYQFQWVCSAIDDRRNIVLIHVDKQSPDTVANEIYQIVVRDTREGDFIKMHRQIVAWGGWSQVKNELAAIKIALNHPGWRYFVNLSGQCYPAKSQEDLQTIFDAAWPNNFIRCRTFDMVTAIDGPKDPHLERRAYCELKGKVQRLRFVHGLDPALRFKGPQGHALTREFCEWLVTSPVARRIAHMLRFTYVPDQTFFQAAIMNSPFRDLRMLDAGRYSKPPGSKTMEISDLKDILAPHVLFARKFDAHNDSEVLAQLASRLGYHSFA